MLAIDSKTIRELIEKANKKQIQKEDIVALLLIRAEYILVYYNK